MSFALPEALRAYIDERVRSGSYGNTGSVTSGAIAAVSFGR